MKKVLVISISDLRQDARVNRQIQFLQDDYDVYVLALNNGKIEKSRFYELPPMNLSFLNKVLTGCVLLFRRYNAAYWMLYPYKSVYEKFRGENFDIIIGNDIESLPLVFKIKQNNTKVVFDAHEFAPRHFEDKWEWRLFFQKFNMYLCNEYISRVDAMITVGKIISDEYYRLFSVRPKLITNAPYHHDLTPSPVKENKVRLIYHGIINKSRKLDNLLKMMDFLDERFELDLMLVIPKTLSKSSKKYVNSFLEEVKSRDRVKLIDPVSPMKIVEKISNYDIGVFLLEPVNFNYRNALPNKLFEFIQARLGVAIGPSIEMKLVVEKYNCGVVAEDFNPKTLAEKLNTLTSHDIKMLKENAHQASKEQSAEQNKERLLEVISSLD